MGLTVALIGLIFIIISLFVVFGLLIKDIRNGEYKVKDISILGKEAEDKFGTLFPENSIENLKNEIQKITELLISGEESNRYTEALRRKAKKDERIQEIKDAVFENVELVKFVDDNLKARIKYKDFKNTYTLILSFNTVTSGRVFLNDYFIFKSKIEFKKVS